MQTDRRDEIAASVAAHQALGPGYDQALAEGLVERISEQIDSRIDERINELIAAQDGERLGDADERLAALLDRHLGCRHVRRARRRAERAARRAGRPSILLPLGSLVVAVSASLAVLLSSQTSVATNNGYTRSGPGAGAIMLTMIIWIVIGVINVVHAHRQP